MVYPDTRLQRTQEPRMNHGQDFSPQQICYAILQLLWKVCLPTYRVSL